jgi:CoA:oxalate CoA-transferase
LIAAELARRPAVEWLHLLEQAGVPCGPVNTIDRAFADPQTTAREMLIEVPHPKIGPLKMAGTPLKLGALEHPPRRPPPLLGEHTESVLQQVLGMQTEEIERLRHDHVV